MVGGVCFAQTLGPSASPRPSCFVLQLDTANTLLYEPPVVEMSRSSGRLCGLCQWPAPHCVGYTNRTCQWQLYQSPTSERTGRAGLTRVAKPPIPPPFRPDLLPVDPMSPQVRRSLLVASWFLDTPLSIEYSTRSGRGGRVGRTQY